MPHKNKIQDSEIHFKIDPGTRAITNSYPGNNTIVQYDHNSERFTFDIPRYVDGHDMAESSEVRVHYINSMSTGLNKTSGMYICNDLRISEDDDDLVTFSWLVSSAATQYIGFLHFSIQFICLNGTKIEYSWNTGVYKDISIIESINNADEIVTNEVDAIAALKEELMLLIEEGGKDGKSAYEIVVEYGYEGTEEEWANSLNPDKIAEKVLNEMEQAEDFTYGD